LSARVNRPTPSGESETRNAASGASWQAAIPWVLSATLITPSLVWVVVDRSIWSWDPAFYGMGAVDAWYRLAARPTEWWEALLSMYSAKAPAIAWFGQFFVPLGQLWGSIEPALLASVLLVQASSLVIAFHVGRRLAPNAPLAAVAGVLFLGASPLFVSMSHHYMTEAFQLFSVMYVYWIATASSCWSPFRILGHIILATSIGFLVKINTPVYFLLPLCISAWHFFRGLIRGVWKPVVVGDIAVNAMAVALGVPGIAWYVRNGRQTFEFAKLAASSEVALDYGKEASLAEKLVYWARVLQGSFLSSQDVYWLLLLGVVGAALALALRPARRDPATASGEGAPAYLVGAAALQIVLVLIVFSLAINEEARFVLPLGPSLMVILAWVVARLRSTPVYAGLVLALAAQWAIVQGRTLGLAGWRDASYWAQPPRPSDPRTRDLMRVVDLTCTERTAGRFIMTGVNLDWLNLYTLSFYSAKAQLQDGFRCFYWYLGHAEKDVDVAWARVLEFNVPYFVSLEESAMPEPDWLNQASMAILRRVSRDRGFVREPFQSQSHIAVYRRLEWPP
jgi:hypothetical protein